MIDPRGIEANPDKVQAVLNIKSSTIVKEAQRLTNCFVALKSFMSSLTDTCVPFFKVLKKKACFGWDE